MKDLEEIGYPIGKLGAMYAELYVANELSRFSPEIGYERKSKTADIYLSKIGKTVEVKAHEKGLFSGEEDYAWAIQSDQLKAHKFDYCVLIGYSKSLQIEKLFVLTYEDFLKDYHDGHFHNVNFVRDLAGVMYGKNFKGATPPRT